MAGLAVAVLPDAGPPQVGVTVTGLDTAAPSLITVEVSWDNGTTWHGVRGAVRDEVTGAGFYRDHVPPLNTPATYRLTVLSGAVVPADLSATITVPSASAWLQDPLNPRAAVAVQSAGPMSDTRVVFTGGSLQQATYGQQVDVAVPQGARMPVASIGTRLLAAGVPLVVSQDVAAGSTAVRDLLLGSGQVVVRGLPTPNLLDAVAHCVLGDVTEVRVGSLVSVATFTLTARQVRPTTLRVAIPWWTYDQVKAIWTPNTYNEVKAARPGDTYVDWVRSPERP